MRWLLKNLQALLGVGLIVAGVALICSIPWALVAAGGFVLLDAVTPTRS